MVSIKQNPTVDSQNIKTRKSKHTEGSKKIKAQRNYETSRKPNEMALGSLYNFCNYFIITINVNGLNFSVKRYK